MQHPDELHNFSLHGAVLQAIVAHATKIRLILRGALELRILAEIREIIRLTWARVASGAEDLLRRMVMDERRVPLALPAAVRDFLANVGRCDPEALNEP